MKHLFLITLLFLSTISFGQKANFSISASYNQPFINSVEEEPRSTISVPASTGYVSYTNIGNLKESYSSKSGGKISGNFSYSINQRFTIESGLQFNFLRYQRSTEVIYNETDIESFIIPGVTEDYDYSGYDIGDNEDFVVGELYGGLVGTISRRDDQGNLLVDQSGTDNIVNADKLGNTATLYTEIPIKFGYSFFQNKLKLKIGFISSFLAYNSVYKNNFEIYTSEVEKIKTADGFSNVMWNGTFEIGYLFNKNWGIDLNYVHSFNSIYDESASVGNPKFNIFSIGLSYHLAKNS